VTKRLLVGALALAAVQPALAGGSTPGVTATTITIGGTVPLTGSASLFRSVGIGADAYFRYVNDHGGVNGRKIVYKYLDDEYSVPLTVQQTRQLVEHDHVLAIFNSVGTEQNLAIRGYLNQQKIPQLFVGTGVSKIADEHKTYPWTIGYLPSFVAEGRIYGQTIAKTSAGAKIAVLYENSDFGKDLTNGLRKGLGNNAGAVVATQSYEVTDSEITSQISTLKASGANTLMLFATPQFAILAYLAAHKLDWHPQIYVSSVSISPNVMDIVRLNVAKDADGSRSIFFVKDPTSKLWAKDPTVLLYARIMKRYLPKERFQDVYNFYGMAVAYTMVDTLRQAGRNPTRASVLRTATHLDEVNPFMLPGVKIQTSPSNYYPITKARFARYRGGQWTPYGGLVDVRG